MNVVFIVLGLAKALGRGAFGGYVAESTAGIKGGAGIVGEDVIQRVAAAKRAFEFFAGAQCNQLAQVHDRDAITMALRLLQIMGGEEQGRAVVLLYWVIDVDGTCVAAIGYVLCGDRVVQARCDPASVDTRG